MQYPQLSTHFTPSQVFGFEGKEGAKLSLCLTKSHAMKTHPLLNKASYHEDEWMSRGIDPCTLNFSTRWR